MTDSDDARPGGRLQILDPAAEREILRARVHARVVRSLAHALRPDTTVGDGAGAIAAMAATSVLSALRVMSGRQLAVLLAAGADRHASYVIREPPRYTEAEIAAAGE